METRQFTQRDQNLTFRHPEAEFNYRVAAFFRCGGHVLLHRARVDDFWALPGGRPHHFESAPDALRREMYEEFGEHVSVGALAAVIEVVFGTVHEVNLCFEAELPAGSRLRDVSVKHDGNEDGVPLIFRWIAAADVHDERILPRPVAAAITSQTGRCDYWFDDERRTPPASEGRVDI